MSGLQVTAASGRPGPLVEVVDPEDTRLAPYRNLNDPAGRSLLESEESIFVVEGKLAVERLLRSGYAVQSLLVDDHRAAAAGDLVAAVRARGAPVFVGTRAVVAETVGFPLHRGVVAVAKRPEATDAEQLLIEVREAPRTGPPPVIAVLEGLNDHENIGALFRNAAAFGVAGVLLDPTCADPLYRRSVRVSMGHVLHVPFARLAPWPAGLDLVRGAGFVVAALTPHLPSGGGVTHGTLTELHSRRMGVPTGVALLLGGEGPGLSDAALDACDLTVSIPMADGVDSINVATAAAVAFHVVCGP
jgi:tRNA G18 (ribose-2'-O)-methylase SpoU